MAWAYRFTSSPAYNWQLLFPSACLLSQQSDGLSNWMKAARSLMSKKRASTATRATSM